MPDFRFYHPIEVRYGDLDPQGHVNNASYMTYLEQARMMYIRSLGLWPTNSFLDIGIILADVHITFRAPIYLGQAVQVGVRVTSLGNKSLQMENCIEEAGSGQELASVTTILVAYDYRTGKTIPVPDDWRRAIAAFENIDPGLPAT
ncbi:MAG: acyl-CoA thioesterase [Omnitrophica WOR_2 bacterium]